MLVNQEPSQNWPLGQDEGSAVLAQQNQNPRRVPSESEFFPDDGVTKARRDATCGKFVSEELINDKLVDADRLRTCDSCLFYHIYFNFFSTKF